MADEGVSLTGPADLQCRHMMAERGGESGKGGAVSIDKAAVEPQKGQGVSMGLGKQGSGN
jgi:hypothetical protein